MTSESSSLADFGWNAFFHEQLTDIDATGLVPARVITVHRDRIQVAGPTVDMQLPPFNDGAGEEGTATVGDWMLVDIEAGRARHLLRRSSLFKRRAAGTGRRLQLIAANVDTLFIVSSCNQDYNRARLERFLALASDAEVRPVLILTKSDLVDDPEAFARDAEQLMPGLVTAFVDARDPAQVAGLSDWCGHGQTVALVGSSGVGKSTLVNTLAGPQSDTMQKTGSIREHDAKGRHTTTARSLHAIAGGGWVIDTPGIRTLYVSDVTDGIDTLFAEITDLAPNCRFRDCTHAHEPGCAVQAAVASGELAADRLERWRSLLAENRDRTPVLSGPKGNKIVRKKKY